jgi:endonuclease I
VIVDGSASEQLKALAHDITPVIPQGSSVRYVTSFNGNDWRTLEKRSGTTWSVIDQIGESENTPSVAWDVAGVGGATVDRTLVRKPYVTKGNTNWSASAGTTPENSEWEIRNLDDFSDLRKHTFDPSALVDPFDFTAVALNRTTIKLSWRLNGAGHNILLVISTDDQFAVPANGTAYAVDDLIGDDKVIAKGSLTTITLQNLVAGQEYFFKIYSFNDLNEYSPGKVVRVAPVKPEPSNHVTNFRVTSFTGSSLSFGWTDDTGAVTADGFLVAISADGATSVFVPTDGTEPANNNFIRKVNRGVQAVTFNFLSNNVTYTAKIYPFTNRGALIDFKTDGSIPVAQGVTDGASLFENIGGELKGAELISLLRNDYRVTRSLGYDTARERMYISIDVNSNDSLLCVYTGYGIKINRSGGGRSQANAGNINAEHTWPQSLGARNEPMRSDLHHIFPTWANVNSARGNLPFAAIPDNQVSSWWGIGTVGGLKTAPPIDVRYKFSKLRDNTAFEPRADHRGNVARAIFYFWMRWQNDATVSANQRFFEGMKETLYRWHYLDLPDEREVKRSNDIAAEQGNRNPFVHDTTLIRRAFFPHIGGGGGNTFTVTSSAVQFNTRRIGASDTLFVFVQNNSGSTSLSLTNIRIEGDAAFSTTASLLSIASGRTGAIPVVFKPTAKAGYTAQLKFSNSFNTNETVLEITGRGGEFAVTYRPSRVRFNLDDVQDVYRTFSVVNTGETVFTLDNVAPNSRFYSYGVFFTQAEFPVIMMPGDSVRFELELDFTSFSSQNVDTIFVMIDGAKQPYALIDATSAVSVSEDMVPKKLALHQNYPNPFNPSTRISFDITSAQFVTLEVFSITGQRVGVLVNNTLSAGRHMVTFDATGLASGLYLYRLTTPSGTLTRKLMLMK